MKRFSAFIPSSSYAAFILPILLLVPSVAVRWQQNGEGVRITVSQSDPHIAQCVAGGLEVRYRLEIKSCRQHGGWFDKCGEATLITRNILYDPVSESYQITTDVINDADPPVKLVETDSEQAEIKVRDFSIPSLQSVLPQAGESSLTRPYLRLRIRGYCQRDDQSWISQIPYHLTFGLFQFAGFDTGWTSYELTDHGTGIAE